MRNKLQWKKGCIRVRDIRASGGVGKMVQLARSNLRNIPRP